MEKLKNSLSSYMEYKNQTEEVVATMKQRLSEEEANANKRVCSPMVSKILRSTFWWKYQTNLNA